MIPRLQIGFSLKQQITFLLGKEYISQEGEYLLNHARSGIVMALRAALPIGGRVGVVAYNCHTVANAVLEAGCTPIFVDVTNDFHIDVADITRKDMDAIVVTNLFGIHNDIASIQQVLGNKPIIVDNAHGYGLPTEGDFTVYSINQGKFPSLGEGGILMVNNGQYTDAIEKLYVSLPVYSAINEIKLFITMLIKAIVYHPWIYQYVTLRMKRGRKIADCREQVKLRKMAKGVSRMYMQAKSSIPNSISQQRRNAQAIINQLSTIDDVEYAITGENGWMVVVRTNNVNKLHNLYLSQKVETATHFANCILWAKQFGYKNGSCPMAEQLSQELLMIPTYKKI